MSTLKYSIAAALLSGLLTGGFLYHSHSQKMGKLHWLQDNTAKLRLEAYQRHNGGQAPAAISPAVTSTTPAPVPSSVPAAVESSRGFRNEGTATPRAAVQTIAWACDQGDAEAMATMIWMSPAERTKAEAFLASQPTQVRERWKSVDDMAAHLLIVARMASPFPAADVLAAVPLEQTGDDQATLHAVHPMQLHREGVTWKCALSANTIEKLATEMASTASQ